MIAKSKRRFISAFLLGTFWLLQAGASHVLAEETPAPKEKEAREAVTPTTQEVVAAIKRRAQQILEERRKARRLQASWEASQGLSYEKNPANAPERNGDWYAEESIALNLSKKLTPTIKWQGSYSATYDGYFEYTDGSYLSQAMTPFKFIWQPGRMWRADAGVDLSQLWYYWASPSSYDEIKPNIKVRQNLWGRWYHSIQGEYFYRYYLSKMARNGAGVDTEVHRQDYRYRGRYEIGTTWKEALFKVRQEYYLHDSNDQRNDFYDAEDYKITASINRPITKKLSANLSYAWDHKQYRHRPVSGIKAEARYDNTQTYTASGTYDFNETWSLNPSFSYSRLNSNDPSGEYFDWTATTTLTARF